MSIDRLSGPSGRDAIARSVLDKQALSPAQRFEAWRAHVNPFFDVELGHGQSADGFDVDFGLSLIDDIILGECRTRAQTFSRSPVKIAGDAHDHYIIQLFLEGETHATAGGREAAARPGDVWIIDMAAELSARNTDFRNVSLLVPRVHLGPNLKAPDGNHLRTIRGSEPMARIFNAYLTSLVANLPMMTASDASAIAPSILRLCEALLNAPDDGRMPDVDRSTADHAVLMTARRLVEERLRDPALSPAQLADALGVSRATLYRLFAPVGGVASYIRGRRLKRSVRDLIDPGKAHRRIYEIAADWGFRNESDYSRAFRRRFHVSPRDARHAGSVGLAGARALTSTSTALDHENWLLNLAR